ncbi:MAG: UDP-3-O-(3-hydroxymyristoyl)glucosamine N-acyltransferase [Acidobacteria bacterium]|nr:UDP-3-O-(3-hydroxymyristoyl)glucosamine N-acyltransferase [Acidobacteriota bacterium]
MTRTAREIAIYVGAELEGDPTLPVSGCASPESAGPQDLIYVDSPRHLDRAARSAARCLLLGEGARLGGKTLLRVANPKLAFAKAAAWLVPRAPLVPGIHPTALVAASARLAPGVALGPYAVIEDNAEIGAGTEIGAFCFVGCCVRLGVNCRLEPRVTLYPGVRLGQRVVVHAGTVIGSDGFGYVFGEDKHWKFPQLGTVEIGDDVEIGANTTIDRGALDATHIGPGVKIDNLVQVAHNVQIGEQTVVAAQTGISGSSVVGKNVLIGGQVGIADHCHIEDGAVAGAQAGIPTGKTIRTGQTVWGTPARPLKKFKEQYAWFARLPELAERLRKLERARSGQ